MCVVLAIQSVHMGSNKEYQYQPHYDTEKEKGTRSKDKKKTNIYSHLHLNIQTKTSGRCYARNITHSARNPEIRAFIPYDNCLWYRKFCSSTYYISQPPQFNYLIIFYILYSRKTIFKILNAS